MYTDMLKAILFRKPQYFNRKLRNKQTKTYQMLQM